jgi:hypothetical protein
MDLSTNYTTRVNSVDVTHAHSPEGVTVWYAQANGVSLTWTTYGDVVLEARGVLGWIPPGDGHEAHSVRGVQLVDVETGKVVATQLVSD